MGETVKTTINIDKDLWTRFSILVIQKHGGRKKNDVIEQIIREYVTRNEDDASTRGGNG